MKNRIKRLRKAMQQKNTDVFFISRLPDIKWLSGFTGSTASVLVTPDTAIFITDGRYETQCRNTLDSFWDLQITGNYSETFKEIGKSYKKITVQPALDMATYHYMNLNGADISIDMDDTLRLLRMIKTPDEIALIQNEYDRAGEAFLKALDGWRFNQPEHEWAALLEYNMKLLGAAGPSFETIVASGERGALPHGTASNKLIQSIDAVTIDFGSIDLYNSDYTRVVYNGNDPDIINVINIVSTALEKAMTSAKPGVKCADIDKEARGYIDSKGFGAYFNHSLGHGVGMEVHELPHISPKSVHVAEEGMVFTIEPGIYIPGKFGIRLEQTVAITQDGCRLLSSKLEEYIYIL